MILLSGKFLQRVDVGLALIKDHVHLLDLVPVEFYLFILTAELLFGIDPVEDRISRSEEP